MVAIAACCAGTSLANAEGADLCANAQVIDFSQVPWASLPWDTTTATADLLNPCSAEDFSYDFPELWFKFTAPFAGVVSIDSGYYSAVGIYNGCPEAGGTLLICAAHSPNGCNNTGPSFLGEYAVEANQTYYVVVNADDFCTETGFLTGSGVLQIAVSPNTTPPNDSCAAAQVANVGANPYQNRLATTDTSVECSESDGDVWFSFTAPSTGTFRFSTQGNYPGVWNAVLAIFDSCGGAPLACNDYKVYGGGGTYPADAILDRRMTAGESLLVRVASKRFQTTLLYPNRGAGTLLVQEVGPLPADTCQNALDVVLGSNNINNVLALTDGTTGPCTPAQIIDVADVWYRFTPTVAGIYAFEAGYWGGPTNNLYLGMGRRTIAVHPSCSSQALACAASDYSNPSARICAIGLAANQPYFIRVAGFGSLLDTTYAGGYATLNIAQTSPVPANDNCSGAISITTGDTSFDTTPACSSEYSGRDLWYRYTNNTTGRRTIRVRTCGSSFDTYLAAFNGCGGTLLAANDTGGCSDANGTSTIRFCLEPSETAAICVGGGYNSAGFAFGPGVLNIMQGVPIANDRCANASPLAIGNNTFNVTLGCTDVQPACPQAGQPLTTRSDVWFTFTAPADGVATLEATTNVEAMFPVVSVFSGCGGSEITCGSGNQACLPVLAGTTYYVAVSTQLADFNVDFGAGTLKYQYLADRYEQPADALPDPESCGDPDGFYNGCDGIFDNEPSLIVQLGDAVSGYVVDPEGGVNDTDAFQFTLTQSQTVRVIGQTQSRMIVRVIESGIECDGSGNTAALITTKDDCLSNFDLDARVLTHGTYQVIVQPVRERTCSNGYAQYWFRIVCADCAPTCDDIDFNNDGSFFDPIDIDALLSIFSEGPCIPADAVCGDIDFNNDGSLFDPCDIDSFLLSFSEGPCTPCGQ